MPHKDPDKRREWRREYMKKYLSRPDAYAKHRARVRRNNALTRARNAEIVAEFRSNGCMLCLERESCVLDAHHVDPTAKEFNISFRWKTEESLRTELAKCVCLCKNCHAKVHAGIVSLP
jgi:hypothetical protein